MQCDANGHFRERAANGNAGDHAGTVTNGDVHTHCRADASPWRLWPAGPHDGDAGGGERTRRPPGAGAIRLIGLDYDAVTVRVLSLPPYLWVDTPALSVAGIDATVLALAYQEALGLGPGSDRARMAYATGVLSRTLAHNFGLVPEHTISIRQGTFVDAIDALGGLSIDLPEDVDGSPSGFGTYRAGRQMLDGQAALDYMSIYPAVGDESPLEWERLARQRQVLQALQAQLVRPQTLLKLPRLVRQFYQDVVTDLGLEQVLALGCLLSQADVSMEHVELPAGLVTPGEGKILLPKTDEIVAYLETAFAR